jgi:hypothetical protein
VLFPVPSRDGRRLAWAERVAGPRNPLAALLSIAQGRPIKDIWGYWQISIGDIVIDAVGNVNLTGIRSIVPGGSARDAAQGSTAGASFFEMQEWGRNDEALFFASDLNRSHPQVVDLGRYDLQSQATTPITSTDNHWEEHMSLSLTGRRLVMMSSECCEWNPGDVRTLVAELYLADPSGANRVQLTRFNTPGAPEYTSGVRVTAVKAVWSPDGRQLAFARQTIPADQLNQRRTTELWLLTFQGACGAE